MSYKDHEVIEIGQPPGNMRPPMWEQYESWKRWPKTFSEPTHEQWNDDCARLLARIRELEAELVEAKSDMVAAEEQGDRCHDACIGYEARIRELEARNAALLADVNQDEGYERLKEALAWVLKHFNTFAQPPEHLKSIIDDACMKSMTADEDAVRATAEAAHDKLQLEQGIRSGREVGK
jgi:hypothetical protein